MILWLVRHPKTAVSEGICYGRTDVEPCEPFDGGARSLIARLRDESPSLAYTSPLSRCRRFASLIGPPTEDPRLRELDFGRWEMKPWSDIPSAEINAWRDELLHWKMPGGESVGEMAARVRAFAADLRIGKPPPACVVTHAGVIRVLACLLWKQDVRRAAELRVPLGSALKLSWSAQAARVLDSYRYGWRDRPAWLR